MYVNIMVNGWMAVQGLIISFTGWLTWGSASWDLEFMNIITEKETMHWAYRFNTVPFPRKCCVHLPRKLLSRPHWPSPSQHTTTMLLTWEGPRKAVAPESDMRSTSREKKHRSNPRNREELLLVEGQVCCLNKVTVTKENVRVWGCSCHRWNMY